MTIRAQLVITAAPGIPTATTLVYTITARSVFGDVADSITLLPATDAVNNGDGTWTFTRPIAGAGDQPYAIVAAKAGYPSVVGALNVPEQSGAGVTGSGTTGKLARWSSSSALSADTGIVDADIAMGAAIALLKIAGWPADANGYLKNVSGVLSWDTPAGGGGGGVLQQIVTLSNADILTLSSVGKAAGLTVADGYYPVLLSATLWIDSTAGAYSGIDGNAFVCINMSGFQASTIISEAATDAGAGFPLNTQGGEVKKLFGLGEKTYLAHFGPYGSVQTVGPITYPSYGAGPSQGLESGNVIGGLNEAVGPSSGEDFTLILHNPVTASADLGGGDGANSGKWVIDYVLHPD